jgi:hypothetical protein
MALITTAEAATWQGRHPQKKNATVDLEKLQLQQ